MEESQRPRYAATQLLERVSHTDEASTGPVDVDALAEALGLDVETFHPATRRNGALGWLEPGEPLIFLRDGLTRASRRFTLAHEIGHFLLHRATVESDTETPEDADGFGASEECDVGDLDAPIDAASLSAETLRPGQAYSARARRESEANQFASYLLLPASRLLASYQRAAAGAERADRCDRSPRSSVSQRMCCCADCRRCSCRLRAKSRRNQRRRPTPTIAPWRRWTASNERQRTRRLRR